MSTKRFLFQRLIDEGTNQFTTSNTTEAREWYRTQAGKLRDLSAPKVMSDAEKNNLAASRLKFEPGTFYLFNYDPITKEKMPYHDRFPLVCLLDNSPKGFMGLNMHYLHPMARADFMDKLYRFKTDDRFDEDTSLRLTYDVVKSISGYKYYKPCIKRYLNTQVKSKFIKIHPAEWDLILMLPLERFVGASKNRVYSDSRNMYR